MATRIRSMWNGFVFAIMPRVLTYTGFHISLLKFGNI